MFVLGMLLRLLVHSLGISTSSVQKDGGTGTEADEREQEGARLHDVKMLCRGPATVTVNAVRAADQRTPERRALVGIKMDPRQSHERLRVGERGREGDNASLCCAFDLLKHRG